MHRVLFEIGPVTIYSFGIMIALAFLAGIWLSVRRAAVFGYSPETVSDAAVPILVCVLLGAKGAYLMIHAPEISLDWRQAISLVRGGFVFYGGLIGGILCGLVWLKTHGLPVLLFGDLISAPLCFGHAIGRLGCWLNGCCYGKPATWGIALREVDVLPRIPAQLIEAGGLALLGMALLLLQPAKSGKGGRLLGIYVVSYAVLRFLVEFLRDDPRGGMLLGLSISQWLSMAAFPVGIGLVAYSARSRAQNKS